MFWNCSRSNPVRGAHPWPIGTRVIWTTRHDRPKAKIKSFIEIDEERVLDYVINIDGSFGDYEVSPEELEMLTALDLLSEI
jgi:hypothetical protein